MKESQPSYSNSEVDELKTSTPPPRVSFTTKLLVIIMMVLILSSGPLYYIEVPLFYYLFLGISILLILILIFLYLYITTGEVSLFGIGAKDYEKDGGAGDMAGREIHNPGLEKMLRAEKRYQRKKSPSERAKRTLKSTKRTETETEIDTEEDETEYDSRRPRIGSIPVEESLYEKRVKLKDRTSEDKKISKKAGRVTTYICPDCGGRELYYEAGLISGYKYHCKDCDYIGTFVIEKDFKLDE